jgi:hypothetical protein
METQKKEPCRKRNGKEVSFDFKLFVIDEINNGQISANYASKKYNIPGALLPIGTKNFLLLMQNLME